MKKKLLWILFALSAFANQSNATHVAGGEIFYCWLHDNTYRFTYVYYRNCGSPFSPTPPPPAASVQVKIKSDSCGYNSSVSLQLDTILNGLDVTRICSMSPTPLTTCDTVVSPYQGFEKWVYSVTIVLPGQCVDWIFSCDMNARAQTITTIDNPGNASLYVEATLNNVIAQNNCSPVYNDTAMFYACVQQLNTWDYSATDADGDSLVYSLVTARKVVTSVVNPVTYLSPYSATNPIATSSGFNLNSQTGMINFMPTTNGEVWVVAMQIDEYRSGNLIGSSTRDHMGISAFFVSVEENERGESFSLSPNPATNQLKIKNSELRIESVEIYNGMGQRVFNSAFDILHSELTVDVSQLIPGIYFVKVGTEKGISAAKFVKQ